MLTRKDLDAIRKVVKAEVDPQFQKVNERFETMDQRFESFDQHFEDIDKRFEDIDIRFESIDKRFDSIEKTIKENHKEYHMLHKLSREEVIKTREEIRFEIHVEVQELATIIHSNFITTEVLEEFKKEIGYTSK